VSIPKGKVGVLTAKDGASSSGLAKPSPTRFQRPSDTRCSTPRCSCRTAANVARN
jgi:hypothetical protein